MTAFELELPDLTFDLAEIDINFDPAAFEFELPDITFDPAALDLTLEPIEPPNIDDLFYKLTSKKGVFTND